MVAPALPRAQFAGSTDQVIQTAGPERIRFAPSTGGFIFQLLGFDAPKGPQLSSLEMLAAVRKYAVLVPKMVVSEEPPETPELPEERKPPPLPPRKRKSTVIASPVRTEAPEHYDPKTMTFDWSRLRPERKTGSRFR